MKKIALKNKTYKIVLGTYDKDGEYYNSTSAIVKATDANDVMCVAGNWILKEEKENQKENQKTFVEEIIFIDTIDIEEE